jgi:uncharacterized protein YndB with AHSA1/START domain
MVSDHIEREIFVEAPVERVWAVMTKAEYFGEWFCDAGADIDLRPGGTMVLRWHEHGEHTTLIEKVEPLKAFSWRWPGPEGTDPASANSTLVEFTFTSEGNGTRVRVVESGFHALPLSETARREYFHGNIEGWRIQGDRLREYAFGATRQVRDGQGQDAKV